MLAEIVAAFLVSVTFSTMYHAPRREYPLCGALGALGWLCYRVLGLWLGTLLPVLAATLLIGVGSRKLAVVRRAPNNIFLIAGIFPIVPGKGIYDTIYQFMGGQIQPAVQSGLDTLKVVGVMVLGIVVAFSLPDLAFLTRRKQADHGKEHNP